MYECFLYIQGITIGKNPGPCGAYKTEKQNKTKTLKPGPQVQELRPRIYLLELLLYSAFFFSSTGFELRASDLLGWNSTT
jgi:hypothetical protein